MKKLLILNFVLALVIFGCGTNTPISVQSQTSNLITKITTENNCITVQTKSAANIHFSYKSTDDLSAKYDGYLAGAMTDSIQFYIPIKSNTSNITMSLVVENATSVQDSIINFTATKIDYQHLEVDFVDIAQGEGNLIITPEGENVVFDGGFGTNEPSWGEPGGEDDGSWDGDGVPIMLNYVRSRDINHFAYLIESHSDSDHFGGVRDIREASDMSYDHYFTVQSHENKQVGDFLDLNSTASVEILNVGVPEGVDSNDNNSCFVLHVVYGDAEFLLTADAERSLEQHMIAANLPLSSDVLKVGHHGSHTSSSSEFLSAVLNQNNKIAGISFGTGNPYGHPHNLSRFSHFQVYGTEIPSESYSGSNYHFNCGTIACTTDGKVIVVEYNSN